MKAKKLDKLESRRKRICSKQGAQKKCFALYSRFSWPNFIAARNLIKTNAYQKAWISISTSTYSFWPCMVQSCFGRLQPPNGRPRPKQPRFFKSHIGILPIWFSMMLVTYICHFTKLASRGTKAGTHFKSTKDLRCRPTLYSSGFYRPPKCIYLSLVCLSHCANFLLANQGWFSFQFSGSLF